MKTTIKYIANADKRIPLLAETSANKLAQLPALKGHIGKTGILELLRGTKKSVKGFEIIEAPAPDRANKLGVEYQGTGKIRQRKPMKIYVKPVTGRGMSERMHGDFALFLTSVYQACHNNKTGMIEYSTLQAESLPSWSRNMISVYANRARSLGFVETIRESNKVCE